MKYVLIIPITIVLAACSQTPVVVTETIRVPTYLPVPTTLTAPVSVDLTGATWGSAVGTLNAAVQTCNARLSAISQLKPPSQSPLKQP